MKNSYLPLSIPFCLLDIKRSIAILLPLFLLFSCSGKETPTASSSTLDSLENNCYSLVMKLQTDSLRTAAKSYMKVAPANSKHFFKARQFYINSYFNARDYEKVLSLLTETEQMSHFNNYPSIVCDYMYTRARVFQYSQRYPEAIEAFKRCLTFTPKETEQQEEILSSLLAAMTQLMNTYVISDKVEEGYRYFLELKNYPTPVVKRYALRDLHSHLGYLAIQADHREDAYRITDSVFVLPLNEPTPEKLFRDYSYAAVVFYDNPDTKERVIQWLQQAIGEADKYTYTAGLEWSIGTLGALYWQQNRVEEAIELHYQSLSLAQKRGSKSAECSTLIDLSTLYKNWELYTQAYDFVNQAIEVILPTDDNRFKCYALNAKAQVLKAMQLPDSAIYYFNKAEEYGLQSQIPTTYHAIRANKAQLLIDNYSKDSLASGIQVMQDVLAKTKIDRPFCFYCLGKGLIKQGRVAEGEAMLDSMYTASIRTKGAIYVDGMLEYTIDHYLSRNNGTKVMQYTTLYRQQVGTRYDEKISRKVTSAMVQYQTEKKEQQLKLITVELAVKDLRIKLYTVAILLLLFVLIGGYLWYLHERKLHKRRQLLAKQEQLIALRERKLAEERLKEQEQQLVDALENLREANLQSEQVREQLDEFLADQTNKQSIASMTPFLFREKGEVKFRRYFTQLYPNLIPSLKSQIPDITRGEEILCMLIALNQNTDEISEILCIEKKSVNMSRYRLRKKIGIEQEDSLDKLIRELI